MWCARAQHPCLTCALATHPPSSSALLRISQSKEEEPSTGRDSSAHSALFDLELSSRGGGRPGPADYLARLHGAVADDSHHGGSQHGGQGHASGDPSVRLPSGLLQRIIYLGRPVMEFELDVSDGRYGARCRRVRLGCMDSSTLKAVMVARQARGRAAVGRREPVGNRA